MATVAAPQTGHATSAAANASSSSATSGASSVAHAPATGSHFVPIRPAFRPLLPKPCAVSNGSSPASSTGKSSPAHIKDSAPAASAVTSTKKSRKSFSGAHKKENAEKPTRRRIKAVSTDSHSLPSTIAPSSLITKRRKSPAGSGLSSIMNPSSKTSHTTTKSSSSPSASSSSSLASRSSTAIKSETDLSSISSAPSIGVRSHKTSIASSLMLSSAPANDLLLPELVDNWVSQNGRADSYGTSISLPVESTGNSSLGLNSIWDQLSDKESTTAESPLIDSLASIDDVPSMFGSFDAPDPAPASLLQDDDFVSYSDNLLESYLTPEPDESEVSNYDPVDFLGPQEA